jgi:hypothetical protein
MATPRWSLRLDAATRAHLARLAREWGDSESAVVRILIADAAVQPCRGAPAPSGGTFHQCTCPDCGAILAPGHSHAGGLCYYCQAPLGPTLHVCPVRYR